MLSLGLNRRRGRRERREEGEPERKSEGKNMNKMRMRLRRSFKIWMEMRRRGANEENWAARREESRGESDGDCTDCSKIKNIHTVSNIMKN